MKEGIVSKSLLIGVSENDPVAFRKLYDLLYLRIYRFCGYFVKSTELKEEIVSDVFLTIWQNRETILRIDNIEAYMYTAVRNRALYYLKQQKAAVVDTNVFVPIDVIFEDTPETQIESSELRSAIEKAVNELPERCRLIFLMAKEEGLKYREIAEILSISEKTVNAQIVTALKRLSESLRKVISVLFFSF